MSRIDPTCGAHDHGPTPAAASGEAVTRAARLFRAMGDVQRLRLLELLEGRELCVTQIVAAVGDKLSTVSQRLGILHREGLLTRRRDGTHLHYSLADGHVADLVRNAQAHAGELDAAPAVRGGSDSGKGTTTMAHTHDKHDHEHGPACGHTAVKHDGHVDYLHDGHLHHPAGGAIEEHALTVGGANPAACTPNHACGGHEAGHVHGPACGHEAVPHGDHVDYLVDGHLHHPHGSHCDDHGKVELA